MKRAVATLTVYIYGETDQELKQKSNDVSKMMNEMEPSLESEVEGLIEIPFGKIGANREIKL